MNIRIGCVSKSHILTAVAEFLVLPIIVKIFQRIENGKGVMQKCSIHWAVPNYILLSSNLSLHFECDRLHFSRREHQVSGLVLH